MALIDFYDVMQCMPGVMRKGRRSVPPVAITGRLVLEDDHDRVSRTVPGRWTTITSPGWADRCWRNWLGSGVCVCRRTISSATVIWPGWRGGCVARRGWLRTRDASLRTTWKDRTLQTCTTRSSNAPDWWRNRRGSALRSRSAPTRAGAPTASSTAGTRRWPSCRTLSRRASPNCKSSTITYIRYFLIMWIPDVGRLREGGAWLL